MIYGEERVCSGILGILFGKFVRVLENVLRKFGRVECDN